MVEPVTEIDRKLSNISPALQHSAVIRLFCMATFRSSGERRVLLCNLMVTQACA